MFDGVALGCGQVPNPTGHHETPLVIVLHLGEKNPGVARVVLAADVGHGALERPRGAQFRWENRGVETGVDASVLQIRAGESRRPVGAPGPQHDLSGEQVVGHVGDGREGRFHRSFSGKSRCISSGVSWPISSMGAVQSTTSPSAVASM